MAEKEPGVFLDNWKTNLTLSPWSSFREFLLGAKDASNCPSVTYVRLEPHQAGPRHAHDGWTINVVIEGSCRMGDLALAAGDVLTCAPNKQYGPLTPGPNGVTLLEIFDKLSGRSPIWDDPKDSFSIEYQKWLEERVPNLQS
jgi:quercetin dioxygenase-like cupin family protein